MGCANSSGVKEPQIKQGSSSRGIMTIYFGSTFGKSAHLASEFSQEASTQGYVTQVFNLAEFDPETLKASKLVVIFVSTYGNGGPPLDSQVFFDWCHSSDRKNNELKDVAYTIFGLGNSSFPTYAHMAMKTNDRFQFMGATIVYDWGKGDGGEKATYQQDYENWKNGGLWAEVNRRFPLEQTLLPVVQKVSTRGPMLIYYGTTSGNSKEIASQFLKDATDKGFQPTVVHLNDFDENQLKQAKLVLIFVSTYGQGGSPVDSQKFFDWCHSSERKEKELANIRYTIFGLGNSDFPTYAHMAMKTSERFAFMGATLIYDWGKGDGGPKATFKADFQKWKDGGLWEKLEPQFPLYETSILPKMIKSRGPVTIYFGTNFGTSGRLAEQFAVEAKVQGFAPQIVNLSEFDPQVFAATKLAIIFVSTYGQGGPPVDSQKFYDWLNAPERKKTDLAKVSYSVFGIGNSDYPTYGAMGQKTDECLKNLGANQIHKFAKGDASSKQTYQQDYKDWISDGLWDKVNKNFPFKETTASEFQKNQSLFIVQASNKPPYTKVNPDSYKFAAQQYLSAKTMKINEIKYIAKDEEKTTLYIDLNCQGIAYKTAGNISIYPENDSESIKQFCDLLGLQLNMVFDLQENSTDKITLKKPFPTPITVENYLKQQSD